MTAELVHAQTIAPPYQDNRRNGSWGRSTSRLGRKACSRQRKTPDVVAVIKGVIEAEDAAVAQYNKLIKLCDGVDYVTQDLCIQALGDEEEHCREFRGFLAEYESE